MLLGEKLYQHLGAKMVRKGEHRIVFVSQNLKIPIPALDIDRYLLSIRIAYEYNSVCLSGIINVNNPCKFVSGNDTNNVVCSL